MPVTAYSHRTLMTPQWNGPAIAVALALHGLLAMGLWQTWHAAIDAPTPFSTVTVRLMREEAPPAVPPEERKRAAMKTAQASVQRSVPDARRSTKASLPPTATAAPAADTPSLPTAMPAAPTDGKLPAIDPDSITRAARAVVRGTTLARESDQLIGKTEAATAQERLAAGVARSATRDCLKGSMDGNSGYEPRLGGLLEIPFLIYDAATGKCRR
jgi:hypothetical protein